MKRELRELLEIKNEKLEFAKAAVKNSEKEVYENAIKEVEDIQAKIDAFNMLETLEQESPQAKTQNVSEIKKEVGAVALAKYIKTGIVDAAGPLKEAEGENGGYLVPEDIQTDINEYRRSFVTLKDLVNVETVSVPKGERTYEKTANLTPLANITELGEIPEVDGSQFERITFTIKDFGGILPVSNTLLQDTPANLTKYLTKWFGKKAIVTENAEILKVLSSLDKTEVSTVDEIKKAMDVTLDPLFVPETKIVTNQSGYHVLNTLKDKNGNYLLQPLLTDPTKKAIDGKEVVVIADSFLPGSGKGKFPLFIGNLKEAVTFYDREHLSILSTHIGGKAFTRNSMDTRMIERFDVKTVDKAAVVYLECTDKLSVVPAV